MANTEHLVQFDELEGVLEGIMTELARDFFKVDPAQHGGDVAEFENFWQPYADRFVKHLDELKMNYEPSIIAEEFSAIIEEFDTVDRAVYAKTDEQEPTQGIAVLVAEHKTKVMQHLQERDEGYGS